MLSLGMSLATSRWRNLDSFMACAVSVSGIGRKSYLTDLSGISVCVEEVLLALEGGVDIYDTFLPYRASEQGMVLVALWKIADGVV